MAQERRRKARTSTRARPPERVVATVRCPFCHEEIDQDALAARCAVCKTAHHTSCFDEQRGCSVNGCTGKAALVVKGWRDALGECASCTGKVYLDENVALCKSCEARHHPPCLEAHGGCAECGSGEGIIVLAATFKRSMERARRASVAAFTIAASGLLVGVVAASTSAGPFANPVVRGITGGLGFGFALLWTVLGAIVIAWGRRHVLASNAPGALPRPTAAAPVAKPPLGDAPRDTIA